MITASCPDRENLFALATGRLPEDRSADLAEHIAQCPQCQNGMAELEDSGDSLIGRLRVSYDEPWLLESEFHDAVQRSLALVRSDADPSSNPGIEQRPASVSEMPQQLGEYELLEELGRGGMGRVYKARHTKLDRVVALKILSSRRLEDAQSVARFEREMRAIGQLDDHRVVRAHDAREIDGTPVLIMEYVEGVDLSELASRLGPLHVPDACELARQAALGLQSAHDCGLVHRDIKPSNIMLARDGQTQLLDLGLARFDTEIAGDEMTAAGQIMGTADYMAPEQTDDSRNVDARTDIYSLGCTLFKLLTGQAPFRGREYRSLLDKMNAHVQEPVPPVDQFVENVPPALQNVLNRMTAKSPEDRFQTAGEVAEALAPFCFGADLTPLVDRAVEAVSFDENPRVLEPSSRAEAKPQSTTALPRRSAWRSVGLFAVFLFGIAILFAAGVMITIRDGDKTTQVEVPAGSQTTVSPDGNVDVTLPERVKGTAAQAPVDILSLFQRLRMLEQQYKDGEASKGEVVAARRELTEAEVAAADTSRERAAARQRAPAWWDENRWTQPADFLSARTSDRLKQIGRAMHYYYDAYGSFPPAVLVGPDGETEYSWRVALLPFLEHAELYDQYRRDEPWDSAHNRQFVDQIPDVYRAAQASDDASVSSVFALVGPEAAFPGNHRSRQFKEIVDGTSHTIQLVTAKRDIPWTKPEDLPYDPEHTPSTLGGFFRNGFHVLMADGSVRFLPQDIDASTFHAFVTVAGGENAPTEFDFAVEPRNPLPAEPQASKPPAAGLLDIQDLRRARERDYSTLQGSWSVVSAVDGGVEMSEGEIERMSIEFDGETFKVDAVGTLGREGTYRIEPNDYPKDIDFFRVEPTVGIVRGIYLFEGVEKNRLSIVLHETPGGERPTNFVSQPASRNDLLLKLRRTSEVGGKQPHAPATEPADDPSTAYSAEFLEELDEYNAETAPLREQWFGGKIPDLKPQQLLDAFAHAAKVNRKLGRIERAGRLQMVVEQKDLNGLSISLSGPIYKDARGVAYRQIVPLVRVDRHLVPLRHVELMYSREGWSSPGYGQSHPPLDGTWRLSEVEMDGDKLTDQEMERWLAEHELIHQLSIDDGTCVMVPEQNSEQPTRTYELDLDYGSGAFPEVRFLRQGTAVYEGVFRTDAVKDFDELTFALNVDGGPAAESLNTENNQAVKLMYQRIDERESANAKPSDSTRATPEPVRRFVTGMTGNRVTIAGSADGKLIAIANGNPTLIRGSQSSRVKGDWKPLVHLLDAEMGKTVVAFRASTDEEEAVLAATKRVSHIEVTALAFSPDGNVLAVGTSIGQVKLFDAQTGQPLRALDDEQARLADTETPENWQPLQRAMGSVRSLAFSSDGELVASCGESFADFADIFDGIEQMGRRATGPGRLKVWDVETAALKHDLVGHSYAQAVAFSPDGRRQASAGRWRTNSDFGDGVILWNPHNGTQIHRLIRTTANAGARAIAFSPESERLVIGTQRFADEGSSTGGVSLVGASRGIVNWLQTVPGWAKPVAFSPEGNSVVVLCGGQSIRLLDAETGELKREIRSARSPEDRRWYDFSILPPGDKLAIAGIDVKNRCFVELWNLGRLERDPGGDKLSARRTTNARED